jgi:ubiquinone biosynthesis protein COQ9
MNSPFAEGERAALIEAILPEVALDGWSRAALRGAARRIGIPTGEALALFPGAAADLVAGFSRWADQRMLDRLEGTAIEGLRVSERIALAIGVRLETVAQWREAVRAALAVLALPINAPLGLRLLYETVDAMWYAAGDSATDFNFYTKRLSLAVVWAATVLYWLEDRSEDSVDTRGFVARRLGDLARVGRARRGLETAVGALPNPFRLLRPSR